MSRVVVALGGNALIRRGEEPTADVQRRNLATAVRSIVALERAGHQVVLTHGNGPQVGYLAIEADAARDRVPVPTLDVLVAETQGQIGYLLAQALAAPSAGRLPERPVAVLVTRVVVDPADPAFAEPTKPIGPVYDEATASALAAEQGWTVARDGSGWRRVVASPRPLEIVDAAAICHLVEAGLLVVAVGGGGVPVARIEGALVGVEAVIDKDLAAVALARLVGADALLLLTDVGGAYRAWGTPAAAPLASLTLEEAAAGLADGTFAPGSMGPKVRAAASFVEGGGAFAAIGALEDAVAILDSRAGTLVLPG